MSRNCMETCDKVSLTEEERATRTDLRDEAGEGVGAHLLPKGNRKLPKGTEHGKWYHRCNGGLQQSEEQLLLAIKLGVPDATTWDVQRDLIVLQLSPCVGSVNVSEELLQKRCKAVTPATHKRNRIATSGFVM
ncbi:hypothetical protein H920_14876 [Fukomys damarensis]|uniref:Uncharacterized protein n=1 Tax=Fukomys damarensis TaxID=885580 RepID=A0A091CY69_FUKDA|nr:hypothetical protein H920_14876 [Fukomys damarensis]